MNARSLGRRAVAAALVAALTLSSWGPGAASAFAQARVSASAVRAPLTPALAPASAAPLDPSALGTPSLLVPSLAPTVSFAPAAVAPAAVPVAAPAAEAARATLSAAALASAALTLPETGVSAAKSDAGLPFDGAAAPSGVAGFATTAAGANAPANPLSPAAAKHALRPADPVRAAARAPAEPVKPEGERRSVHFPLWLAAAAGAFWGGLEFARAGAAFAMQSGEPTLAAKALGVAAIVAMVATGAFVLNAVVDGAVFAAAMWRGRGTGDAELRSFLRREVMEGRLDGNAAALIKPYHPEGRFTDLTFAFASRGSIWVRPELAATPWLLRQVLLHELHHLKIHGSRGPPRGPVRGALSAFVSELRARVAEFRGPKALSSIKVPALSRALTQTQVSLKLSRPYEVLVLNPDAKELEDPGLYAGLSGGAARVTRADDADPAKALAEGGRRWRAVVLGRAARLLPDPSSKDGVKLESALKQLDSLFVLATRLSPRGAAAFAAGSEESRGWSDLVARARKLKQTGGKKAMNAFEAEVRKLWRQIASDRLKGVAAAELVEGLYAGLRDRGMAFLSFQPGERGVVVWERMLRYWEAADGGQFRVTRVDLEDGGHLLILRKLETRVGLWLRPLAGGRIAASVPNASMSEQGMAEARKSLQAAGFADQLELFEKMEVSVRHVFGADVGRQEIYVTVPRRNAGAIRRFVSSSSQILRGEDGFAPMLMDSAELQGVKPVWQAGLTGAGGAILWVDTGADASHGDFGGRLDTVDMVDEGPEDWIGHGTHVAGISISGNDSFLGMAKGARGTMAKVFSRDQPGASDGEIMGSAAIGQKKGVDVISLSLGSRGSAGDNMSEFFSQLTKQKNAAGEYPIVTASAGNSGPFDRTLSQPAAGVEVIAVAAAAKSKDDGVPEISFYSSVGPDHDRRFSIKRVRLKPEVTGIGGDVTTEPGSSNVYKHGVYSAKSKDSARSPSDLDDGAHTGMSGTSMSNPAVAGIALLVKLAMRAAGAINPFVAENMAFAVKAVLMRTSRDMGAPVWFQGAGLVDAWAAVSLVADSGSRALGGSVRALWRRLVRATSPQAPEGAWAWLERLKAVHDAEDRAYAAAESAKAEASRSPEEEAPSEEEGESTGVLPEDRSAAGNAIQAEVQKRFNAARDAEIPALLEALKDPVWLIRFKAAAVLMNLKSSASALALAEAGLNDADPRVRRMALLALAEIPTHRADALLAGAAQSAQWDTAIYAAYALARRGDRGAVGRIVKELASPDKRARFSAVWLLGQVADRAGATEAEGLSARVRDRAERGNIRHLAAAALSNLADAAPESLSDKVVTDLLDAAGPENLALTRTIAKVFPVAARSKAFIARLRRDPLKPIVTDFVTRNREALTRPGPLGELVQLLARAAGVPLDAPTSPSDASGAGVSGVDEALGPLDLIVLPPEGAQLALDESLLGRFESSTRAVLPTTRALWLSVPEHKLYALTLALEHRGWTVRRSLPYYPQAKDLPAGPGTVLDFGDGEAGPTLVEDAASPLVRVRAGAGVSEARVMAALEGLAAAAQGKPLVIALSVSAATGRRTPLTRLVERLVARGAGVVVGAGNAGPRAGTVVAPGGAAGAAVVAAAGRASRELQFYSSRGTPESPRVTWTDLVDDLLPGQEAAKGAVAGTAAAAELSAEKLATLAAELAAGLAAAGRALPLGWFPWLVELVSRAATPMPGHAPHEVGAGLFDSLDRARDLLKQKLLDPETLARETAAALDRAFSSPQDGAARGSLRRAPLSASFVPLEAVPADAALPPADPSWWKDPAAIRAAVTVPLYSLRRAERDPGVGKFGDLARVYRDELSRRGAETVLLLPHFATLDESPYAPVSLYALNEDHLDWALVPEVAADPALAARLEAPTLAGRQSVDYAALRAREAAVAAEAWARFRAGSLAAGDARAADFKAFLARHAAWLDEYAEFMALRELTGKPPLEWAAGDEARARADARFSGLVERRRFAQWLAYGQFDAALRQVRAAGGKVLFDIPMFRAKDSADAWKRPALFADLRTRNPGIKNRWVHEDWKDLALWRWSRLKADGYRPILDAYRHWLDFGFDGARADALHFAYLFGNGQLASGDEPGDDFVAALAAVFQARGAFPLAEAFEGKDEAARRHGFVTVGHDWRAVSTHDTPRQADFMVRYLAELTRPSSGASAAFVAYTYGDEWRDPFPVKEMSGGRSLWRWREPLASDPDFSSRARDDDRAQLAALAALRRGRFWEESGALLQAVRRAAGEFVKQEDGETKIWAASMDWFLEEWGRDAFISLPGLLLTRGLHAEAASLLRRFARFERDGLIPNRVVPGGESEYNSADAPMWYLQAVKAHAEASGDWSLAEELAPVIRRVLAGYERGTSYHRYGRENRIYMDADGLVVTPAQSTWMDADPEGRDRPVTPRNGKAVEINALWYSNLRFASALEARLGRGEEAARLNALADRTKASFNAKFWFETPENAAAWGGSGGALRDAVEGDPHGGAIRPNMLIAVSKGGDLLDPERRAAVVLAAAKDLLTPVGLRTLSPRDSHYRERYETGLPPLEKDQAYHQGTVWPWLMGPFVEALAIVRRDQGRSVEEIRAEARALIGPLAAQLVWRPEGSLPEVYDGGPAEEAMRDFSITDRAGLAPFVDRLRAGRRPGGTRSQAWSVAELLRLLSLFALGR